MSATVAQPVTGPPETADQPRATAATDRGNSKLPALVTEVRSQGGRSDA
jgi:hypothetical protein